MNTALLRTTLLITVAATFIGCSGGSKLSSSSGAGGVSATDIITEAPVTDTSTTATNTWPFTVSGATAAFAPVSWQEVNSYVALRPLNNPSNMMVNIDIQPVSGLNIFAGIVRIGYTDNGQFHYGEFSAGTGINPTCKNCLNNDTYESAYNHWATVDGKRTLMAYFQDQYGSIILTLERDTTSADGEGSTYKGKIFWRNFGQAIDPQSPYRKCWYIYAGPYGCYSAAMANKSSTTAIDGYSQLGSFSGLKATIPVY